jgi:sulfonate transport system ATP-binding protein
MTSPASTARHAGADQVSVRVRDVVRRFGPRQVLDGLDLSIARSEFVVLLGPSGCGKSTLLRLLAGLDLPDGGEVEVPRERAIVFQGDRLLPWQRVWRNVTIGLRGPDPKARALEVLAEVGLSERANAWPKTLSGGEAQRVALARALVTEPDLVLLDEPFSALDAITRLHMHDLVRRLHQRHGAAMLLVTHDVAEAIALGDRILVMDQGRIGSSYSVRLSDEDRRSSQEREDLRGRLLADLGLAGRR